MIRHSQDRGVGELDAVVEFEPLQMPAVLRYRGNGGVGKLLAARYIQTLKPETVVCHGEHRDICQLIQARHVQREEGAVAVDKWLQAQIREFAAVRQREPLDAFALRHPDQSSIADLRGERRHIEPLDQILIREELVRFPYALHHAVYTIPPIHRGAMPQ